MTNRNTGVSRRQEMTWLHARLALAACTVLHGCARISLACSRLLLLLVTTLCDGCAVGVVTTRCAGCAVGVVVTTLCDGSDSSAASPRSIRLGKLVTGHVWEWETVQEPWHCREPRPGRCGSRGRTDTGNHALPEVFVHVVRAHHRPRLVFGAQRLRLVCE